MSGITREIIQSLQKVFETERLRLVAQSNALQGKMSLLDNLDQFLASEEAQYIEPEVVPEPEPGPEQRKNPKHLDPAFQSDP